MNDQPDLSFYFAIHQAQRNAIRRYRDAVASLTDADRADRSTALRRWAKGFTCELDEHHYAEDAFFFPSLRATVVTAAATIDGLEADHRALDDLLAHWPAIADALVDQRRSLADARGDAVAFADRLGGFLDRHLAVEEADLLPLFWRHYSAAEYDAVVERAMKKSKKAGMWFVAPFTVDCYTEGTERDAFLDSVPGVLRLLHRLVRPSYDRMLTAAFGTSNVTPTLTPAATTQPVPAERSSDRMPTG